MLIIILYKIYLLRVIINIYMYNIYYVKYIINIYVHI